MVPQVPSRRPWLSVVALVLLAAYAMLWIVAILDDCHRYYFANPETSRSVCTLEHPEHGVHEPRMRHDFDGDGTEDEFSVEYFHMEPLFGTGTSGLLRVRSGSDGSEHLVRGIPTPIDTVIWVGDLDGNGTDDLFVANSFTPACLLYSR